MKITTIEKIDKMYPDISKKLHKNISIHEKEIMVSSFDYYERALSYRPSNRVRVLVHHIITAKGGIAITKHQIIYHKMIPTVT